jgi:superfamily II DNA or RNA helicase
MTRQLRGYQREAVAAVYADWAESPAPTAIVLPTGCGKSTVVAQHCVDEARRGGRTLVLGEREDWLANILTATTELDPDVSTGWAQADRIQARRQVIGGMVQTLQTERRRRQMLKPTKVIIDECDLAVAPRYADIMAWAGCDTGTPTFGVTATLATAGRPKRGQRGIGDVWPRIAYQRDIAWAVDQGWLVPPRGKTVVVSHMDLDRAKVRAGDYQDADLGRWCLRTCPRSSPRGWRRARTGSPGRTGRPSPAHRLRVMRSTRPG